MGVNFFLKTCRWVIILMHKASELVTISIILPGNECKLNKMYCDLVNFGSCGLFLFIDDPALVWGWVKFSTNMATHPHANQVEVTPGPPEDPKISERHLAKWNQISQEFLKIVFTDGFFVSVNPELSDF